MRIYIAGALSSRENTERNPSKIVADYIQNVHKMCQAAAAVMRRGHTPFIPALDFLFGVVVGDIEEDIYRELGLQLLRVSDAVLVISESWGAKKEIELAMNLGKVIYYNIEQIPLRLGE